MKPHLNQTPARPNNAAPLVPSPPRWDPKLDSHRVAPGPAYDKWTEEPPTEGEAD